MNYIINGGDKYILAIISSLQSELMIKIKEPFELFHSEYDCPPYL